MKNPKHIVITGASSGLGAALAEAYASPDIVLGLLGRDEERLTEVRWRCESKGAAVQTGVMDVTDAKAMAEWLTVFDALHPIDLVIANAGISGGSGGGVEGEAQTRKIFDVNVNGVLNTVLPVVPQMVGRGK
ncbi:MAG: SDR family NAD(P)-dependent oxidoreductase, partial [Rickettsiales bacterium]